jgi:L-lactate dehydrogenase complex protein LldG
MERLTDYGVTVSCCQSMNIAGELLRLVHLAGDGTVTVPEGFPKAWLPPELRTQTAESLTTLQLDRCVAVVTTCALAIADTGTVILQSSPGQGPRRASLIPDLHICIVTEDQVVDSVPAALKRLRRTATLPTTFISGPSATSDIEMQRIQGVHGPRKLAVLIVTAAV